VKRRNLHVLTRLSILAAWSISSLGFAQGAPRHYILILDDPPVASRFASREALATVEAGQYRQQIATKQTTLRQQLAAKHFTVIGGVSTVLNAMFVAATPDRVGELKALPGVTGVVAARRFHRNLNEATLLVNAPAAWTALGGVSNAGAGIRIGILDTGIEITRADGSPNPAFYDPSLPAPTAFSPVCDPTRINTCSQPAFTNNKVIVARSYVGLMAAGGAINPSEPQLDSRPDDITPRDHIGHGTAVSTCAAGVAGTVTPEASASGSGTVAIGGVAPKAYLGEYRVYGSPGVNENGSTSDIVIMALDDAVTDGMDVVSFSSGGPAISAAEDTGAACGYPAGVFCDPVAHAFEIAAEAGTIITVAAGNDGPAGGGGPGTIESPGDAPSVITLAASTNSHYFTPTVSAAATGAPSNLLNLAAGPSDSAGTGSITAPLRDVTVLGDPGTACNPLPAFSLAGHIALIERGTCDFSVKLSNAQGADATGVLLYMADSTPLVSAGVPFEVGTDGYGVVPTVIVDQTDGLALKSYIDANAEQPVTINTNGSELADTAGQNELATFSSLGPNLGPLLVKPELTAPGEEPNPYYYGGILMATETYDSQGEVFSGTGFGAFDGTSFSTPITAGAAALVLQAHPKVTGAARLALVRSALVNNTAQTIVTDDLGQGDGVDTFEIGSGLLNAGASVASDIVVSPSTLAFSVPPSAQQFTVTNNGASAVTLDVKVSPNLTWDFASSMTLTASTSSVSLAAGASQTVTITPGGTTPGLSSTGIEIGSGPGDYTGSVTLQGSGVSLIVPYVFVAGDGALAQSPNIYVDGGDGFDGTVGQDIPVEQGGDPLFQIVDDYGLPIAGVPVAWTVSSTTATNPTLGGFDTVTNQYGLAGAGLNCISCTSATSVLLGSQAGTYYFTATTPLGAYTFSGTARVPPAIRPMQSVENAASFDATVSPGSYVAIFGAGLTDGNTDVPADSTRLPLAIGSYGSSYVNVSFDVPSAGVSVPGHFLFVSPGQVNVQVPWELQQALAAGQNSAFVKVTIDYTPGNVVTIPIQAFSPAVFNLGTPSAPQAAARDNNTGTVIGPSNPETRGQYVQVFVNGLGPVENQPASGDSADPTGVTLSKTTSTVTVNIGPAPGVQVTPAFSGLAPGYPGLYQVNFQVPTSLSAGNQPFTVSVGGVTSQASALWVK
jgi:uncharacterized protein (TIGR03437 family)